MPPATEELGEYLGLEEPLTVVCSAQLSDDAGWTPATVGLTDRRLLCLADDGTFVSVHFDAVSAIRGHERGALRYGEDANQLLVGAGVLVAVVGLLAVGAVADGLLVPALTVTGLGALVLTERERRRSADRDPASADPVGEEGRSADGRVGDRFGAVDGLGRLEARVRDRDGRVDHYADRVEDYVDRARSTAADVAERTGPRRTLLAGCAVGVGCFLLAALVVGTPLVLPGLGAMLAGAGLADYGRRNRPAAGESRVGGDRVREVRVSTDGGRDVHIRTDPADRLDRDLGRLAAAPVTADHPVAPPHS